jgi:integrase
VSRSGHRVASQAIRLIVFPDSAPKSAIMPPVVREWYASPMCGNAVRQAFARARLKADMPGFRFHDLRQTGQTLAASAGATLKDLMRRLGHASPPPRSATCMR